MIKKLYKSIFTICLLALVFAGSPGKSHSVELLHWGRHTPLSLNDNILITANTFVSTKSRIVKVYNLIDGLNPILIQEIVSQYPMPGDDFGFSIDHYNDFMIIGAPGYKEGEGAAFLYKKVSNDWKLYKKFENPFSQIKGKPHKFGYSVSINNKYVSISSPFNNDGLVHIYRIDGSSTNKIDDIPTFNIDVRKIGDAAGFAAMTLMDKEKEPLTIEFKINFLNIADGEKLIAEAIILQGGRSIFHCESKVYTKKNKSKILTATALVTIKATSKVSETLF